MIRHTATLAALVAIGLVVPGCGDDAPPPPPAARAAATGDGGVAGGPGRLGQNRRNQDPPPPPMQVNDNSFIENIATARDPFHSYFNIFISTPGAATEQARDVKLARYSLDDLRLVAVVIGTDSPYAMVVDGTHSGTILRRGMYVGRQEFVSTPQGGYNVHWRVARIEPGRYRRLPDGEYEEVPAGIVFERHNPLDNAAQVVERTITLASGVAGAATQQQQSAPIGPIPGVNGPTPGYLPANLGGGGPSASAIQGTQNTVQQAVNGSGPQQQNPQTTVVVQVPPSQTAVQPVAPSNNPPPIQVYNGTSSTH